MGLLGFCSTGTSSFDAGAMSSMKMGSSRGYQPMRKDKIIASSASWRFIATWISYQTFRKRLLPLKCIKLKYNQGDIFALQLRGHIAFA
jgi:hypothetical protein